MTSTYTLVAFCSNFIRKRTSRFQEIAQVSSRITLIIYCTKVRHIPVYWTWNENILCSKKPCSFANSLYRTKAGLTRSNVIRIRCLPLRAPILRFHLGPGEHTPPVAVTTHSKRPLTVTIVSTETCGDQDWVLSPTHQSSRRLAQKTALISYSIFLLAHSIVEMYRNKSIIL